MDITEVHSNQASHSGGSARSDTIVQAMFTAVSEVTHFNQGHELGYVRTDIKPYLHSHRAPATDIAPAGTDIKRNVICISTG
jgi:hypothetical protein